VSAGADGPGLDIRPADEAELPALVRSFGEERYFPERLGRQSAGRGLLLVAWLGDEPVGHGYLSFEPADEPQLGEHLPGVPLLSHLEVVERHRDRGLGTAMVAAVERQVRQRGHGRVALGVAPTNAAAKRFYRRLGFDEWPYGPVPTHRVEYLEGGGVVRHPEICHVYVKEL